mmetsp:Transcript_642/g.920  ORF Transcript_642/g.920 Transcript_642/m.920 type:complete len:420 (-) Transcript_642:329-1588(-)|eukprot:CAMPEP_0172422584 /NCGR_PEP_ID=MMETSP1064-20121228/8722_1 /TAXON_ID=202472 /ORGANISM="Aulacoseira subarctica , Strain CCAP 1002/5" /LENGTH=419 /DNA_ID=CAMNT_0013163513 /DNA_START=344 /DNA_END=1603 /DNA_ORIENTATION=-
MQTNSTFRYAYSESASSVAVPGIAPVATEDSLPARPAFVGRSVSFIANELDESRDAQMEEVTASSIATGSTTYASWPQHCADIRRSSQGTVVHGSDTVSVMEKIAVLRHLEREDYAIPDYLDRYRNMVDVQPRIVDEFCREQICEWSYRVVDYFDINREVVDIALSYLDRFLVAFACDRKTYKLAATTALFLAVKLHDEAHKRLKFISVLANLSRGEFQERNIIDMERLLLRALGFRVHPPTSVAFINHFLLLPPFSIAEPQEDALLDIIDDEDILELRLSRDMSRQIFDMACFYSELAVLDYSFVTNAPSVVALASILEAMDRTGVPSKAYRVFCNAMDRVLTDGIPADELLDVQTRLRRCYERAYGSLDDSSGDNLFGDSAAESVPIHGVLAQAVSPVSVIPSEPQKRRITTRARVT